MTSIRRILAIKVLVPGGYTLYDDLIPPVMSRSGRYVSRSRSGESLGTARMRQVLD